MSIITRFSNLFYLVYCAVNYQNLSKQRLEVISYFSNNKNDNMVLKFVFENTYIAICTIISRVITGN